MITVKREDERTTAKLQSNGILAELLLRLHDERQEGLGRSLEEGRQS